MQLGLNEPKSSSKIPVESTKVEKKFMQNKRKLTDISPSAENQVILGFRKHLHFSTENLKRAVWI